jgi:hypothetical protein
MVMRVRVLIHVCLLATLFAAASPDKREPDAVNITGNKFESTYFQFHYSFPQGWITQDNQIRMEKNRNSHKAAEKQAGGATVLWTYDLLLASAMPTSAEGKLFLPYIQIFAIENSRATGAPGTYARMLARSKSLKLLREPEQRTFSGRKFVRTDLIHNDSHYEALFDTTVRSYLLLFQFHGRTKEEMDTLARTMESIQFEK